LVEIAGLCSGNINEGVGQLQDGLPTFLYSSATNSGGEDPYKNIKEFNWVCSSMKHVGDLEEAVMMRHLLNCKIQHHSLGKSARPTTI